MSKFLIAPNQEGQNSKNDDIKIDDSMVEIEKKTQSMIKDFFKNKKPVSANPSKMDTEISEEHDQQYL